MKTKYKMTIADLDKSSIWTVTTDELAQMIIEAKKKQDDYNEYEKHYANIIRPVFDVQFLSETEAPLKKQLENNNFKLFSISDDEEVSFVAIKRHEIKKVTDLSLENIQYLTTEEVLKLIANNMGTGWKGLPLTIQDIIESAFFVDCTVLPTITLRKPGGIIDRRKEDGYEVLEIEKGSWLEAIFMKPKPKVEKVHIDYSLNDDEDGRRRRHKHGDDEFDEDIEEETEEEDMNDEELRKLDGDSDEELEDEELDESNLEIEDIEVIDDGEEDEDEE